MSAAPAKPPFSFDALPFSAAIVWGVCVALAILCNAGSLAGKEWIWTDQPLVHNNPLIAMLSGLQQVWTGLFSAEIGGRAAGGFGFSPERYLLPQFSPLSQTMFFIERALFGDDPTGYRVVSMLLHGSCAAVLYLLLRGLRMRGALVVVLLFVVHPVLVDSVSFVSERRNPLGGLLGLSGLYILFRGAGVIAAPVGKFQLLPDDRNRLYAIGGLLMVLALFAQPALAPLGLVGMLVIWAKRLRVEPVVALVAVGVAVLGVLLLGVASRVERAHSPYTANQWERAPNAAEEFVVRTQIAARALVFYTQKSLLPYPLAADYGRWVTPNDLQDFRAFAPDTSKERFERMSADVGMSSAVGWVFPLLVAAVLVALFLLRGRLGRLPIALAASFVLLLLPFLGFIDFGWMQYSFVSHRALYLAVIPVLVGLVLALTPLLGEPSQRASLIASTLIVLVVMTRLGVGVSFRYQYNLKFWRESDVSAHPKRSVLNILTPTPWYSRFQASYWLLNYEGSRALLEPQFRLFRDALDPRAELAQDYDLSDPNAYVRLVNRIPDDRLREARVLFATLGRTERIRDRDAQEATQAEMDALDKFLFFNKDVLEKLRPGNQEALLARARVLAAWRQDQDAMEQLNFIVANYPSVSDAFRTAGDIQRRIADREPRNPNLRLATLEWYEKAAQANPLDAEARMLLAETAWDIAQRLPTEDTEGVRKRMTQAAEAFDAADEIRPYDVSQLLRAARTLTQMGLFPAAASRLALAHRIEPQNAEVLLVIGDTALAGGQLAGAESAYRRALENDEMFVQAYLNYSAMLAGQGRFEESQELLDKGLQKLPENPQLVDAVSKLKEMQEKAATQPAATQPGT